MNTPTDQPALIDVDLLRHRAEELIITASGDVELAHRALDVVSTGLEWRDLRARLARVGGRS